jgi:F0F1-type ATP synthase alpha subunit
MRLVEVLKQGQYVPMDIADQVSIIFAGTQGGLDKIPVANIREFEEKLIRHLNDNHSNIMKEIRETGELKSVDEMEKIIEEYSIQYLDSIK